jgi:hypothetical protein
VRCGRARAEREALKLVFAHSFLLLPFIILCFSEQKNKKNLPSWGKYSGMLGDESATLLNAYYYA